ncbi:DUF839 domain-containing protein [Catellatospora sp. KI3]|uniref:alkaline phosphatase PhoX n=1 Tax=Catellatospora sp. KI3 TaxID=3041620 RepID=UPI00248305F6|nr:alkaline phosphatase PhoX [Catellatospora sp. KI3]MDI1462413.1 DUF839 domain-containing protein [Catellatospora sp. KI3]
MVDINRRTLLRGAAVGAVGAAGPFAGFLSERTSPRRTRLAATADQRDGRVRLWLPDGFAYRSFHDTEQPVELDDGTLLPGRPDGMAAFPGPDGSTVLIRNHEIKEPGPAFGPAAAAYDPMGAGGTSTVQVTRYGEVLRSYASLSGTASNCCGGRMPWGAWISCEETVNGPDVAPDYSGAPNIALTQRHGFIFEVPRQGRSAAEPITAAGRFSHESVAYDPREGVLYLTEDNFKYASCFYRYLPPERVYAEAGTGRPGLADGGRLQALRVAGRREANLAAAQRPGAVYPVEWVDIDDPAPTFPYTPGEPAPTGNDEALCHVGDQARERGAAWFSRLEGSVHHDGTVYFTSTQGGGAPEESAGPAADGFGNGRGQIWAYQPREQVLRLVFQAPHHDGLDFPDNITASSAGTLILCEDGAHNNYVRGLTRDGRLLDIALNRIVSSVGDPRHRDEFAGAVFSPDGHTMFVNVQAERGMTFAIWGPWPRLGV